MHRSLLVVPLLTGLVLGPLAGTGLAQSGTPVAGDVLFPDTMGLPELAITITDEEILDLPTEIKAGRYVVSLTNEGSEPWAAGFVRLPEGREPADLSVAVEGAEGMADSSPEAEADGEEDNVDLDWLFDTYIAGGPGAEPGQTRQAILDLPPGDYAVWPDDPEGAQAAVALIVTGEMPTELPAPGADVTVTEVGTGEGYAFELDGELVVGPQVIEIVNKSDQPHFMILGGSPEPITLEQLEFLLTFDPTSGEALPADIPDPDAFTQAAYGAVQSPGTTQWVVADLVAADHILLCFVPDPNNEGIPHALEGMADVITVGEG